MRSLSHVCSSQSPPLSQRLPSLFSYSSLPFMPSHVASNKGGLHTHTSCLNILPLIYYRPRSAGIIRSIVIRVSATTVSSLCVFNVAQPFPLFFSLSFCLHVPTSIIHSVSRGSPRECSICRQSTPSSSPGIKRKTSVLPCCTLLSQRVRRR